MTVRVVIAPDSFKGSLSASDAAAAVALGLRSVIDDIDIIPFPMADGGEGTLAMIASHEGVAPSFMAVPGADGAGVRAPYCLIRRDERDCAVIESASIVGMAQSRAQPLLDRSTRGIGRMLRNLLEQGLRSFVLALGGSATNDGGAGLLAELGVAFVDAAGRGLEPTPRGLLQCARVDFAQLDPLIAEVDMLALADVDNPLAGAGGATRTFGPQKGLAPADVALLDAAIMRYGALCDAARGVEVSGRAGSGAAGGLGFAVALLGRTVAPGAAWLAERYRLAEAIASADWVITGEGRSDAQTLRGKAPSHVAQLAAASGVPVSLLSGSVDANVWPELSRMFYDYRALARGPDDTSAISEAASRLAGVAAEWAAIREQEKSSPGIPRRT